MALFLGLWVSVCLGLPLAFMVSAWVSNDTDEPMYAPPLALAVGKGEARVLKEPAQQVVLSRHNNGRLCCDNTQHHAHSGMMLWHNAV